MAITAHPASQYQKRTFAQKLNEGVGRGLELGSQIMQEHKQEQELKQQKQQQEQNYNQENDTYRQLTGRNLSRDPKIREKEIEHALRGENEQKKIAAQLQGKSFGKEEDKKQQEIADQKI